MKWADVRVHFPDEWVVCEVLDSHLEQELIVVDAVSVIERFHDSDSAMSFYYHLHRQAPERDYCFAHTSREQLTARQKWAGMRGFR